MGFYDETSTYVALDGEAYNKKADYTGTAGSVTISPPVDHVGCYICVWTTTAAYLRVGGAATANSRPVISEYYHIFPLTEETVVSAMQIAAAGTMYVSIVKKV